MSRILFPSAITDDIGADPDFHTDQLHLCLSGNESETEESRVTTRKTRKVNKIKKNEIPEGVVDKIFDHCKKHRVKVNESQRSIKEGRKLKKDPVEDAFPLQNRTEFYSALLPSNRKKKDDEEGDESVPKASSSVVSYVAIIPGQKETETVKMRSRDLLLNDKVMKEIDGKVAGDQREEIKPKIGKKKMKKIKKEERESTKGDGWFGMKAPELTEEKKLELEVLQMRSAIDPKRFYKKNDNKGLPKYFQIGKVVDSAADYYSNRTTKKAAKRSLVDELMADAEYQKYSKRKYLEIVEEKAKMMPRHKRVKKKAK